MYGGCIRLAEAEEERLLKVSQKCVQNPVKHLRWSALQIKFTTFSFWRKKYIKTSSFCETGSRETRINFREQTKKRTSKPKFVKKL